ncbi:response regulator [Pedobacter ureilyticus]|uniref:Response regulator n=1 Tax=Pedobacter ureilyticus TaxID=1393051 RepID=A0ABW9J798_9SPHI|nr:response regulator [Pedobacter helvus]
MKRKTILICDDDPGILEMLELVLEDTGHDIIPEANSLNVRAIVNKKVPDLVILDLWMPVLSGDQVLKMFRENPSTKDLPVIVISASTDGNDIALKAGATHFLAKPFDVEKLLELVEEYLN